MKNHLKSHFRRIDVIMTICMVLAEALAIGRIWVAWDTYTLGASVVWTLVTIIMSIVIILQLIRCHYSNVESRDTDEDN